MGKGSGAVSIGAASTDGTQAQEEKTTIGRRLVFVLVPALLACTLLYITASAFILQREATGRQQQQIGRALDSLSTMIVSPLVSGDLGLAFDLIDQVALDPDVHCVQLDTGTDRILYRSGVCGIGTRERTSLRRLILTGEPPREHTLAVVSAWPSSTTVIGDVRHAVITDAALAGILMVTVILVSLATHRVIIGRPIARLIRAIDMTVATNRRVRLTHDGFDEIGRLIAAYDRLAEEQELKETRLEDALRLAQLGWWSFERSPAPIGDQKALWSAPLLDMLGIESRSAPPTAASLLNRIVPEDRETVAAVLASGDGRLQFRCRGRGGRLLDMECVFRTERDARGRPVRVFGIVQDITVRKEIENALRDSEARLALRNTLLAVQQEASPDGLIAIGPDGEVLSYNRRFLDMWGLDEADMRETDRAQIKMHIAMRVLGTRKLHRVGNTSDPTMTVHDDMRLHDGRVFERHSAGLVAEDGTTFGRLWSFRDVTDRRTAEAALAEAKDKADRERLRAEEANAAKSKFLATMSHELRTPLNAILGFSEMISGEAFGKIGSPKYVEYAADIHAAGSHLLDLISDILDMAKIESGKLRINPEPIDLSDTISRTVRKVRSLADEAELRIEVDAATAPQSFYADQRAINQVLLNLLSNAIKFTPPGGNITVKVSTDIRGDVEIAVTDTGIGMETSDLERVFLPFEQASDKSQVTREGTGLGLPIVRALVTLHGGDIRLKSEPGIGTAAIVHLPARAPANSQAAE